MRSMRRSVLHLSANARSGSTLTAVKCPPGRLDTHGCLPERRRWLHSSWRRRRPDGAHAGIPQIVFGQGARSPGKCPRCCRTRLRDHPRRRRPVEQHDQCFFLDNRALRDASEEVAAEMATLPCPSEVARKPDRDGTRKGSHHAVVTIIRQHASGVIRP